MEVKLPFKDVNKEQKSLNIRCSYLQILVDKNILPVYIYLKPDNQILIKLDVNKTEKEVNRLINIFKSWFSELKVIDVYYE